jgi:1-acyl-sn-glycerol-3-phosphate acyltransferase
MSQGQCIHISNHRSTLDFFCIGTLGLKNTRYFISGENKKYWPLRLIGMCIDFFFIPNQGLPKERTLCFKEAEKVLRKTGDSVFLTPEGHKQPRYKLENFNRGAFHMAANLKIPISPFYIHVPEHVNMGKGMQAKSGVIDIFFLKPISAIDWEVKNIDKYKTDVHKIFLDFENNINETVSKL